MNFPNLSMSNVKHITIYIRYYIPGRVVVSHGLGVAPSLEDRVGLHNLVLKGGLALLPLSGGADGGKVGNDLLGVLSLSGTRLSSDKD